MKHPLPSRTFHRQEAFDLMKSYFSSGLRPSQFYPVHGMTESQFYSWRSRYLRTQDTDKIYRVEIEKSSPLSGSTPIASRPYEVHYPNGVKLFLPEDSTTSQVMSFIETYHHV
jgi:hypothetical protein